MTGTKAACLKWLVDAPDVLYDIKEHKEHRSLTANAYYWVLVTKIAGVLRTSKEEVHDQLLQRYGQIARDKDGHHLVIAIRKEYDPKGHGHFYYYDDDDKGNALYFILKSSSKMDSREFSILLDGCISECEGMGIDTMTPAEVAKLKGYVKRSAR